MSDAAPHTLVTRNDSASRYEIHSGGELAAFAEYRESGTSTVFTHTETLPEFAGKGMGLALVAQALADAVARDRTIVPLCPFVARYLQRNDVPGAVIELPPSE